MNSRVEFGFSIWLPRWVWLLIITLLCVPSNVQAVWSKLTADQQATIISEVKAEVAASLRAPDSNFLPRRSDGSVDPDFEILISKLADPGTTTLSQYAGQLVANDYSQAMKATADWAGAQVLASFRANALAKLPKDSAATAYMTYLAGKPELWKQVGKLIVSDKDWYSVFNETWTLLSTAMTADLTAAGQKNLELYAQTVLTEMFGKWASAGYLAFLQAEIAYIREAEKLAAKVSLDNYYKQYYKLREQGADESEAWAQTSDHLIGESGLPSLLKILQGGSIRDLRIGGTFSARADELPIVREEFRKCYQTRSQRCLIETTSYFDEQLKEQEEQRNQRKKKTQAELAAQIKEAGGFTRDDIRSVYSHFARLLREKAVAAYQATDAEQQELAMLRYEFDQSLARLQRMHSSIVELAGLSSSVYAQLGADIAAGIEASSKADKLPDLVRACMREKEASASSRLPKLSRALATKVDELKAASSLACDFGTPQSQAEAGKILRDSRAAHEKVGSLANFARSLLAQLAGAVAGETGSGAAATNLGNALDELESVTAFADQAAKLAELKRLRLQVTRIFEAAQLIFGEMENKASPWLAQDDIRTALDEASRIVGTRVPYLETSGTMSEYRAVASVNASNGEKNIKPYRYQRDYFPQQKEQGWVGYADCKIDNVDDSAIESQIVNTDNAIDTQIWAADLCLQQARQLADPFGDVATDSDDPDEAESSQDSGWGGGQHSSDNRGDSGSADSWSAGERIECSTPPGLRSEVAAAIAQLQAAVSQTDEYAKQLAAINNLVNVASHPDVCPDVKAQIRATLAELQNANKQELAAARQENLTAVSQGRADQQRRRQNWARVASGLAATLRTLQQSVTSTAPTSSGSSSGTTVAGRGASTTTSSTGTQGPNANSAECEAIGRQINNEVPKWQRLATSRPSKDQATQWCNEVKQWQANFSNLMERAQRAGCASLPQGFLAQSRQISQTNCAS